MVFKSHCGYNIVLQSSHMNKTALCIVFTTGILQGGWLCHFSTYVLQSILALLLMFVMVVLESEISSYKCTSNTGWISLHFCFVTAGGSSVLAINPRIQCIYYCSLLLVFSLIAPCTGLLCNFTVLSLHVI